MSTITMSMISTDVLKKYLLYAYSCILGILIGLLAIPGDGNPAHLVFVFGLGIIGYFFAVSYQLSIYFRLAIGLFFIAVLWALCLEVRNAFQIMDMDYYFSITTLYYMKIGLPVFFLVIGFLLYVVQRKIIYLIVSFIPFLLELAAIFSYLSLSPLEKNIFQLELHGISVSGSPSSHFSIHVRRDRPESIFLADLPVLQSLHNLTFVSIDSSRFSEKGVCAISTLKEVKRLNLGSVQLTAEGMNCLSRMNRLEHLKLSNMICLKDTFSKIESPFSSLKIITFIDCRIEKGSVEQLTNIRSLKEIYFIDTDADKLELEKIKTLRPDIRYHFSTMTSSTE